MVKQRQTSGLSADKVDFIKLLDNVGYQYNVRSKFWDFCEITAYSLRLPFGGFAQKDLDDYQRVYSKYTKEQILIFGKMFDILVNSLEDSYHDFLGMVFMNLDMGNDYTGQFFTPYCVCKMMAEMNLFDAESLIAKKGYITINEPCSGAGAMLIAIADCFKSKGINFSNAVYMVAQDIDYMAFLMSYIQLSLCGTAATVIHGDTLAVQAWKQWHTPAYYLNGWALRLEISKLFQGQFEQPKPAPEVVIRKYKSGEQITFNFEAVA